MPLSSVRKKPCSESVASPNQPRRMRKLPWERSAQLTRKTRTSAWSNSPARRSSSVMSALSNTPSTSRLSTASEASLAIAVRE